MTATYSLESRLQAAERVTEKQFVLRPRFKDVGPVPSPGVPFSAPNRIYIDHFLAA